MRGIMLAILAAGAVAAFGTAPAAARDYPYCLVSVDTGPFGQCYYTSYQQCMATASGTYAYCQINPRLAQGPRRQPWGVR